jgi:hypothetical protein
MKGPAVTSLCVRGSHLPSSADVVLHAHLFIRHRLPARTVLHCQSASSSFGECVISIMRSRDMTILSSPYSNRLNILSLLSLISALSSFLNQYCRRAYGNQGKYWGLGRYLFIGPPFDLKHFNHYRLPRLIQLRPAYSFNSACGIELINLVD